VTHRTQKKGEKRRRYADSGGMNGKSTKGKGYCQGRGGDCTKTEDATKGSGALARGVKGMGKKGAGELYKLANQGEAK